MIKVATYTKMLTLSEIQKKAVLLVLVLVIVACTSNTVFASPPLTHLSAKTYGVGEVLAMEQDKFGFLWIGGRSGLARYDGYTFDQYRATPASTALRSNAIYDLASDSLGNLWIATEQGLNLYNYAEDNFSYIALIDAQGAPIDSTIYHMHLDSSGKTLWLATRAGLYSIDIQSQRLTRYPRTEKEAALQSEYVLDIADDGQGTLYMATGFGLRVWNQKSGEIKSFQVDNPKDTGLRHNIIRSVLVDSLSRIWVGTDAGLLRFIPSRDQFEFIPNTLDAPDAIQGVAVWDMMEDDEQQIWVAYDGHGIGIVDSNGKITANYQHNPGNPQSPSFNVLRRFYQDNEKSIWMSYYPGGLSQAIKGAVNIKALIHKPGDPHSLSMNNVRAIYIDRNDKYWIGTDGGGLNSYDPASDSFEIFRHSADDPTSIGANETLAIKPDADNNLWLGSWVAGISIFNPAERRFFKRMVVDPGRTETPLSSEHVWDVLHHSNGTVWIATIGGGLNIYNPAQKTMKHMINEQGGLGDPIADHKIWSLLEDKQGFVWLGTQNGISRIAPDTLMTKTWRRNQATEDNGLTADRILDIYEDSNNNLWFAGDGGGLIRFDSATEKFSAIRQADGLISDTVVSIIEDETKNLWLGTDKGLSRYSLMTGAIFNLHPGSNLQDEGFNYGAVTKSPRGELAFGGINGLTIFDPRKITPNTIIPPVVYTQLEMIDSNTEDGDKLVQRPLQTVDSLLLNHHQNIFSISFSALSYQRPGLNQYKYKLEGFDREWRSPGIERRATYTNLPAGNYAFLVMASNSDGVWTPTPASLRIKITPAPWNTWWAYSIYILSLTAAVFYVWNNQRRKIQLEQSTNRELLRIDKLKDEFLVSTSDELREPLFGIIGLAENIIDNKNPQARKLELNNLSMIVASANRLSALVDDVADFAKIRSKKISLDIKSIDIYVAATLVSSMLQPLIALEKVKIINQITKDLPAVSADENRIQQILHNLIDFAIRHSAEEVIYLDAQPLSGKNLIQISIHATGMHISERQFMQLCGNPEQQADGSSDEKNADLALVITRELVKMHGGNLYFDTNSHAGTRFSFTLPLEQAKATTPFINPNMNMIKRLCARGLSTLNLDTEPDLDMSDSHKAARRFRILVVDDEEVNRRVLRNHLASQHYNVVEAGSGSDALAIIAREEPLDLIVLDLIMPNMSGLELCQNIRQRHSRQDLPIILVTNKFNIDDVMASFSAGGNDLLSKPVSRQELLARVDLHLQLLVSRRDLEEKVHERTIDLEAAYKKLEELTLSDPLTGLGNRRLLEKVIAGDTSEAMRIYNNRLRNSNYTIGNESDMVFFLLDIDFFKKINDTYGHLAGDKVLINVATILKDICRKSDYAIRWGGEEFLFIARYTHRENAQIIAERLLQRISSSLFDIGNGKSLSITCSIGFCTFPPVPSVPDALTWDETINIADACLYAAKKTQRNAWVGINKAEMDFTLADLMHNNPEKGFELKTSIPSKHLILWE